MTEPLTSLPVDTDAADDAGDALRLLRRSLQRSRGFALLVCTCDMPAARNRLIATLGAAMPDVELIAIDASDPSQDLLESLAARVTDAHPQAFMVVVADALLADPASARSFLDTLNLRRAEWPRRVPHPVAFWLPRRHLGEVTRGAPDFFDWRSDTIDFPEVADNALRPLGVREWQFGVDPRFSPEERDERLRELKSRIAAVATATDEAIVRQRLAWWDEVAELELLRGEVDEALRIREEEELPAYRRLGNVHAIAVTQGQIADILQDRGQLDEALRIREQEQLPIFRRLGAIRSIATTQCKIAEVLQDRGQFDLALRILEEEALPIFQRLDDARSTAISLGRIADIQVIRGELDKALRIRMEEQLPVYRRLGDVREIAVTQGQIADILQHRGQFDEALYLYQQEALPAFQHLGEIRAVAITHGKIADILQARGQFDEALRIREKEELPVFQHLGDIREVAITQGKIADILQARGQLDEALRIREQEELPALQRIGEVHSILVARTNLALTLIQRATSGDADRARELLNLALADARRLGLPDAGLIEAILQQHNLQPEA